ncbi:hypothetical protein JL722_134 [Aureococcus anophagefferens]|nr:hypothetical protein JL722_134 [Aureococcus anophagefferens]
MTEARSGVLEALSDDVLRELCCYLPGRDLASAGMCSRGFESRVGNCAHLWRELCVSLLGEARVALHKDAWREAEATAAFYRRLFDAALKCAAFRYETDLRQTCAVTPIGGAAARPAAEADRSLALLVRQQDERGWCHVTTVRLAPGPVAVFSPDQEAPDGFPGRRLRHASCVVTPPRGLFPANVDKCALVLGGYCDVTRQPSGGGLRTLWFLALGAPDGSRVVWRRVEALGPAPAGIWHHACDAFDKGSKVVVFGGDVPPSDPEFREDRRHCAFVYVLDLAASPPTWTRRATSGDVPTWRSLHVACSHAALADGSERLVVLGGTEEHTAVFTSGPPVPEMAAHCLDLRWFVWRRGPSLLKGEHIQAARLRFGAERYGLHLLVYGGHDDGGCVPRAERVLKLNLRTLEWGAVAEVGSPASFERGGRRGEPPAAPTADGDDSDDDMVRISVNDPATGAARSVVLPASFVAHLVREGRLSLAGDSATRRRRLDDDELDELDGGDLDDVDGGESDDEADDGLDDDVDGGLDDDDDAGDAAGGFDDDGADGLDDDDDDGTSSPGPTVKAKMVMGLGRFFRDVARAKARRRRYGNRYALMPMMFNMEAPVPLAEAENDATVTWSELEDATGLDGAPHYLSIKGRVYDVSASAATFYGVGKSYHAFVGTDASRAFALGCTEPECVSDDLTGLSESELREIDRWTEMYDTHDKYHYVGKLVEDPVDAVLERAYADA